jgi:hypothetical protein
VHKRDQLRSSIHFIPNFACHDVAREGYIAIV